MNFNSAKQDVIVNLFSVLRFKLSFPSYANKTTAVVILSAEVNKKGI